MAFCILCNSQYCIKQYKCFRYRGYPEYPEEERVDFMKTLCGPKNKYQFFITIQKHDKIKNREEL